MKYISENDKSFASSELSFESQAEFISKFIDLYSAAEVHPDYWLTNREKLFFICAFYCVKLFKSKRMVDDESYEFMKANFRPEFSKAEAYSYIKRVQKKGWWRYSKKQVFFPPAFKDIMSGASYFELNVKMFLNEVGE